MLILIALRHTRRPTTREASVSRLPALDKLLTLTPSAIVTKYTSLRSYHEQTKKGSPLDYENAGIYTAALFDAYTVGRSFEKALHVSY